VKAIPHYLSIRPAGEGLFFITSRGTTLTKATLTKATFADKVKDTLSCAGIDTSHYRGHTFRIGAASTAVTRA
jgi:hypothetical protein